MVVVEQSGAALPWARETDGYAGDIVVGLNEAVLALCSFCKGTGGQVIGTYSGGVRLHNTYKHYAIVGATTRSPNTVQDYKCDDFDRRICSVCCHRSRTTSYFLGTAD